MLLASTRLPWRRSGERCELRAIGRDKGNSGAQGQGRAAQATEHGPIWRKGIAMDSESGRCAMRRLAAARCVM